MGKLISSIEVNRKDPEKISEEMNFFVCLFSQMKTRCEFRAGHHFLPDNFWKSQECKARVSLGKITGAGGSLLGKCQ